MKGVLASTLALVCVATLAMGCGSAKSANFTSPSTSMGSPASADDGGTDSGTTFFSGSDGGAFAIGPQPEAGGAVTSVCTAGIYNGQFMTYVGAGMDGGMPGLFSIMWNGGLSLDLAAKKVVVMSGGGNGESFGTNMSLLEIADGGALDGGDMYGGTFYATLDGELDCAPDAGPPYHLSAKLVDGRYTSFLYNLPILGQLTADYQASTPPMLTNGQILVYSPDAGPLLGAASAGGSWSATWASP